MGFKWKIASGSKYTTITLTDSLFQYSLIGLEPNTSYSAMAFLTTYSGTTYGTVYGKEITFTTSLVGVSDIDLDKLIVYPNPVKHCLYIEIPTTVKVHKIQLVNMLGQVMRSYITNTETQFKLSLEGYSPGVYGLIISTETATIQKKIIVE